MKKCILLAFVLLGCAPKYPKVVNSWIGQHRDALVSNWGVPTSVSRLSNGNEVLQYVRSKTSQTGGTSLPVPMPAGSLVPFMTLTDAPEVKQHVCRTTFSTNSYGQIVYGTWEGECERVNN